MTATALRPHARAVPSSLLPLARFEARRLLRHPVLLVGAVLSVLTIVTTARPTLQYLTHTMIGQLPIGLAALVALFLAASRTSRDDAAELVRPLPAAGATRDGALLLGALMALTPTTLLVGVLGSVLRDGGGLALATPDGVVARLPTALEVLTPMVAVLACAALGVLLGRLLPHPVVIPALALVGIVQLLVGSWSLSSPSKWLLPFVDPTVQVDWVQLTPDSGYAIVDDVALDQLGWHLGYVLALAVTAALTTLAVDSRRRGIAAAAVVAAGVTIATGVLQLGGAA